MRLLPCFLAFILIITITGCSLTQEPEVSFTPSEFTEGTAVLNNPYRGFYYLCLVKPSGETTPDSQKSRVSRNLQDFNGSLVLLQINIGNYANNKLPKTVLSQIDAVLDQLQNEGHTAIVRIVYDWDEKAINTEPEYIKQIAEHINRIAPTLNKHRDIIFTLQGSLVGNWGEMHSSNYSRIRDYNYIITRLADSIDPSIFLSVRTPWQLREILDSNMPVGKSNAFDGSLAARVGLYNDGIFGSRSDIGTYSDTDASAYIDEYGNTFPQFGVGSSENGEPGTDTGASDGGDPGSYTVTFGGNFSRPDTSSFGGAGFLTDSNSGWKNTLSSTEIFGEKWPREAELSFQDELCSYVPNGGEVILGEDENLLLQENILSDMRRMHLTYLNRDHDIGLIDRWKNEAYEGGGAFDGLSFYDYIDAHLGYRYYIKRADAVLNKANSSLITVKVLIENKGFAPAYRDFDAFIKLTPDLIDTEEAEKSAVSIPVDIDTRTLKAGTETELRFDIPLKKAAKYEDGDTIISFGLTDPATGRAIQFANENTTLTEDGVVELGRLRVE